MSKKLVAIIVACACALACFALAACSAPAQSRSTESISAEATDVVTKEPPSSDPFYVLVVGNDSRKGTVEIDKEYYADGLGRSDTMMLVRVDPKTYKVALITIPRDTACWLNPEWEYKINESYHQGGMEALLSQVQSLTGVMPDYYLDTTFVGFENLIDQLDGVDVWVPIDMSLQDIVHGDQIELSAGDQHLNGPEALVFARVRKAFSDYGASAQESYRQNDDRLIVQREIMKVASGGIAVDVAVDALLKNCETNFDADDLKYYVKDFAENADKIVIYSATGPYEGDTNDNGDWLAFRDEDAWRQIIAVADAGEDPNTVVPHPEF